MHGQLSVGLPVNTVRTLHSHLVLFDEAGQARALEPQIVVVADGAGREA